MPLPETDLPPEVRDWAVDRFRRASSRDTLLRYLPLLSLIQLAEVVKFVQSHGKKSQEWAHRCCVMLIRLAKLTGPDSFTKLVPEQVKRFLNAKGFHGANGRSYYPMSDEHRDECMFTLLEFLEYTLRQAKHPDPGHRAVELVIHLDLDPMPPPRKRKRGRNLTDAERNRAAALLPHLPFDGWFKPSAQLWLKGQLDGPKRAVNYDRYTWPSEDADVTWRPIQGSAHKIAADHFPDRQDLDLASAIRAATPYPAAGELMLVDPDEAAEGRMRPFNGTTKAHIWRTLNRMLGIRGSEAHALGQTLRRQTTTDAIIAGLPDEQLNQATQHRPGSQIVHDHYFDELTVAQAAQLVRNRLPARPQTYCTRDRIPLWPNATECPRKSCRTPVPGRTSITPMTLDNYLEFGRAVKQLHG